MKAGRHNIYTKDNTSTQIAALVKEYGDNSKVIAAAVDMLWRHHFQPESIATDATLEHVRKALTTALFYVDLEAQRREEA